MTTLYPLALVCACSCIPTREKRAVDPRLADEGLAKSSIPLVKNPPCLCTIPNSSTSSLQSPVGLAEWLRNLEGRNK